MRRKTALKNLFDFSNFPSDHELHDRSNARVTLKFKDELGGKLISEFVGLKAKLYSIKLADGEYTFKFFFGNRKTLIPITCKRQSKTGESVKVLERCKRLKNKSRIFRIC